MWQRVEAIENEPEPAATPGTRLPSLRGELLDALGRLVSRALARSSDPRLRESQGDALAQAAYALDGLVRELVSAQASLESERDGRILLNLVVETEHALAEVYGAGGGERAAALAVQLGVATRTAFRPGGRIDWSRTRPSR